MCGDIHWSTEDTVIENYLRISICGVIDLIIKVGVYSMRGGLGLSCRGVPTINLIFRVIEFGISV